MARRWAASVCRLAGRTEQTAAPVLVLAGAPRVLAVRLSEAKPLVEERGRCSLRPVITRARSGRSAGSGAIAREQGRYEQSAELHREALRLAQEAARDHDAAVQLNYLLLPASLSGDLDMRLSAWARMCSVGCASSATRRASSGPLMNLGTTASLPKCIPAGARLLPSQCLDLCEELSFREGIARTLNQHSVVGPVLRGETERAALQCSWQASPSTARSGDARWQGGGAHAMSWRRWRCNAGMRPEAARQLASADRPRAEIGAAAARGPKGLDRERTVEADAAGARGDHDAPGRPDGRPVTVILM